MITPDTITRHNIDEYISSTGIVVEILISSARDDDHNEAATTHNRDDLSIRPCNCIHENDCRRKLGDPRLSRRGICLGPLVFYCYWESWTSTTRFR